MECVEIVVAKGADRSFSYAVGSALQGKIAPGQLVRVPFGRRRAFGIVLREAQAPEGVALREVEALVSPQPLLCAELLELGHWLAERYLSYLPQAFWGMLPPSLGEGKGPREVAWVVPMVGADQLSAVASGVRGKRAKEALESLAHHPQGLLRRELAVDAKKLQAWQTSGLVSLTAQFQARDPHGGESFPATASLPLTSEQEIALRHVTQAMNNGGETLLLHGVTGSGKTEVYLQAIAACLARGRGAIVLVPEIALTPQAIRRFVGRFGNRVAVLHSRLSDGERRDQWWRVRSGEADVVLGTRSAVFAPLPDPGLIVLDEEHEPSYKQEEHPQYHAREVAAHRALHSGGVLLLGSATPSLETYRGAMEGTTGYLQLTVRVNGSDPPRPQVIDMRQELVRGNRGMFSRSLTQALEETFTQNKQAILFVNRRGLAGFVLCRECGESIGCPNCAVSLALHDCGRTLLCHHCGHRRKVPQTCPSCGGKALRPFAAGTEQVEREVLRLFPRVRTIRMDLDTVRRKGSHGSLLDAFAAGEASVLIGTQMVAKGLDLPRVTLVGVVAADISLNLPDFHAQERTFQLLAQVAGRSGRGQDSGRSLFQTYNPENPAIQAAAAGDYPGFFATEIRKRQELNYPPWTDLLLVEVQGAEEEVVAATAAGLVPCLRGYDGRILVTGPAPAPIARLRGFYRYHVSLRGVGQIIRAAVRGQLEKVSLPKGVKIRLVVDPQQIM